jgi:hypothetical protein
MTMDDQDREFGGTSSTVISDPVDAVLERLNSKSNQTVYETIIEVYYIFARYIGCLVHNYWQFLEKNSKLVQQYCDNKVNQV